MSLQTTLSAISSFVWGPPLLILLSGTGLYLTLRLGFLQIRYLPRALGYLFARGANKGKGDVSSFAALCTALAATHWYREHCWCSDRSTSRWPGRNFLDVASCIIRHGN